MRWYLCGAASPLEGYQPHEWVAFERALVVRDIFTGGVRTFLSTEDAQAFRSLIYKQYSKPVLCLYALQISFFYAVMPTHSTLTTDTLVMSICIYPDKGLLLAFVDLTALLDYMRCTS